MQKAAEAFEFKYHEQRVQVQPKLIGRDWVYALYFEDGRSPLIITQAKADHGGKFWTSLPEGRLAEAEELGAYVARFESNLPAAKQQSSAPLRLFE